MVSAKYDRLQAILSAYQNPLVCYSGGVDSAFLLKATHQALGDRVLAFTAKSPSLPKRELEAAIDLVRSWGISHLVVDTYEVDIAEYAKNPVNRCYFCKTELLSVATRIAQEHQRSEILLGTNADEILGHRPGLKAASEHQARHPLVEAELTKDEIRALSKNLGLPTWDKPQMACLASRFPYGTQVTPERLSRVEKFEDGLHQLGFRSFRVRFHDTIARLEIAQNEMPRALEEPLRSEIITLGKSLGFVFISLDLAGFKSGSMNQLIKDAH